MTPIAVSLRKYPFVFDRLNVLARVFGRRTALFDTLSENLPAGRSFSFVQIGANDGISHDPFREFMIRSKERGVAVEPVPEYHQKLVQNYRCYPHVIPEMCAVGYPSGTLPFYAFSEEYLAKQKDVSAVAELAGLAGFDRNKLCKALGSGHHPSEAIRELWIPVRTVEELLDAHGFSGVDCLFMDCEGHEANILTNLDFGRVKPKMIAFEHTHLASHAQAIEEVLALNGFKCKKLEFDTVAVKCGSI